MNTNGRPSGEPAYQNRPVKQNGNMPHRKPGSPRKRKLRFTPNKEGLLALAALILIAAVVITLLVLTIKAIVGAASGGNETEASTADTTASTDTPPVKMWHDGYTQESVSSSDISSGSLILVNFKQNYSDTDRITAKLASLYGSTGHNTLFVLNNAEVKIRRDILQPMRDMLEALIAANSETLGRDSSHDRIIISSGYRDTKKQTSLYENAAGTADENLVAKPGYSEHHTGYVVDLKVFTADGKTVNMRDNEQAWMEEHCAEYGFVVRYDGSKFETTGILDEPWHYRYVGIPHATYMTAEKLCLEEYLDLLKTEHAYPAEPLEITAEETEYLVYYVPVSGDSTTFIPVPPESVGTYEISGNNVDGFIVTVTKK